MTEDPRGGEPLESVLLLELAGGPCGLLGFTTARLAWTRWEILAPHAPVVLNKLTGKSVEDPVSWLDLLETNSSDLEALIQES